MTDNIKIIEDLDDSIFEGEDIDVNQADVIYDEVISDDFAHQILGDSYVGGRVYKLITMSEGLVLTSTDPSNPKDVFEYTLDEEDPSLQSYADMMYDVMGNEPIPATSVEYEEHTTVSDFAFKFMVILLITFILVGIGIIIFLLKFS